MSEIEEHPRSRIVSTKAGTGCAPASFTISNNCGTAARSPPSADQASPHGVHRRAVADPMGRDINAARIHRSGRPSRNTPNSAPRARVHRRAARRERHATGSRARSFSFLCTHSRRLTIALALARLPATLAAQSALVHAARSAPCRCRWPMPYGSRSRKRVRAHRAGGGQPRERTAARGAHLVVSAGQRVGELTSAPSSCSSRRFPNACRATTRAARGATAPVAAGLRRLATPRACFASANTMVLGLTRRRSSTRAAAFARHSPPRTPACAWPTWARDGCARTRLYTPSVFDAQVADRLLAIAIPSLAQTERACATRSSPGRREHGEYDLIRARRAA